MSSRTWCQLVLLLAAALLVVGVLTDNLFSTVYSLVWLVSSVVALCWEPWSP